MSLETRAAVLAIWTVVLVVILAIRISLGPTFDPLCTAILVLATSIRFACPCCCSAKSSPPLSVRDDYSHVPDVEPFEIEAPQEQKETSADTCLRNEPEELNEQLITSASVTSSNNRLLFLDNVKTFLTALVVIHHVTCAFGACGEGSWFLIIGQDGPVAFHRFGAILTTLNQSFFMPLFFFISAYFVPSSYAKKGGEGFRKSKKQRLWIPAMGESFLIVPACTAIANLVARGELPFYGPYPGVAWFIFWLLIFNWVYSTLVEAGNNNDKEQQPRREFPSTIQRLLWGIGVCGVLLLPFLVMLKGDFASMPISVGSFTCDFLMFYLGIQAKTHGWLETSLSSQLDIRPLSFACMVFAEALGIAVTTFFIDQHSWVGLMCVLLAGVFCLDMGLLVLLIFQQYMNFENRVTKFLARSAYGVYLLHPLVIVGVTALYAVIYNMISNDDPIIFRDKAGHDDLLVVGTGGEKYIPLGWTLVTIMSNLIVWPLAYGFTCLPYLKNIL